MGKTGRGGGEGFLPQSWIELKQDKGRGEALRHIEKSCEVLKTEQIKNLKQIQWFNDNDQRKATTDS